MDCRTGDIHHFANDEARAQMERELKRQLAPLTTAEAGELEQLPREKRKNRMRNKPCPCGSNTKFKRCCWSKFA